VVVRLEGFLAKRFHFAGRVLPLECGQIDHRSREFQPENFCGILYTARGVFGHTLFHANEVDRTNVIEQTAKCSMSAQWHEPRISVQNALITMSKSIQQP